MVLLVFTHIIKHPFRQAFLTSILYYADFIHLQRFTFSICQMTHCFLKKNQYLTCMTVVQESAENPTYINGNLSGLIVEDKFYFSVQIVLVEKQLCMTQTCKILYSVAINNRKNKEHSTHSMFCC